MILIKLKKINKEIPRVQNNLVTQEAITAIHFNNLKLIPTLPSINHVNNKNETTIHHK